MTIFIFTNKKQTIFIFFIMKAIERLYKYIDYKGVKPTVFERLCGLSNGYLSVQKKRNADIGESVLKQINDYCHDLSISWLLTGEGSMLKDIVLTLSERLEDYKIENGLSYYNLGNVLGITPFEMRELINKNQINEEHINSIAEKFDISKEWFLTGKGEMPKINREKIKMVSEPEIIIKKEDNKISVIGRENELLKEANTSLKETNELLKYKIKSLETEIELLKNQK